MLSLYHRVSVFSILIDRNLLLGKKCEKKKNKNNKTKSLNLLENLSSLGGSNEKPRFGCLHVSAAYLSETEKKISWIK